MPAESMSETEAHAAAWRQLARLGYVTPHDRLTRPVDLYRYDLDTGGTIRWNVTLAQCFIAEGRSLGLEDVSREQMAHVAATYDYDRTHVATVDPRTPGIAAPLIEDGAVVFVVIDGIHRLVRAYATGQPFQVHVLSDVDTRMCVLQAPEGRIPE